MAPSPPPETDADVLSHRVDSYNGVIIETVSLPEDAALFTRRLQASLAVWREAGRRGVWLELPLERASLVPVAVGQGFSYHHAESRHLMLTHWLDEGPSTLPAAGSTQVGVGAFVLNSAGDVLVVQERTGPAARPGFWKLPTGLANQGEHVHEAVCREMLEETGLHCDFVGVIGYRHAHAAAMGGRDDIFFMCALRLQDPDGDCNPTPQPSEIADARWMPLEEFGRMPHVADPGTVWGHLHSLCVRWATAHHPLIEMRDLPVGFRPGNNTVYSVAVTDSKL